MALIELPHELSKAYWDKKKGALPPGGPVDNLLKALEKKHDAVDWGAFEPGWEKGAKTLDALNDVHAGLDRTWRSKVFPLKLEAQGAADAAQKLLKDKASGKPTLEAAKAIIDAAKGYAKAVDEGAARLEQAHEKAAAQFKGTAGGDDEDESGSALVDPKRLLSQLQMCKRMPDRRVHFAFMSDGKTDPVLSLAPKTAGRQLFSKLQAETGVKTGAYGQAWVTDNVLFLQMEKPYSGLVKKMRAPLKAVGFKVSKIVLAGEDGTVLEEDLEADDAAPGTGADGAGTATATLADAPADMPDGGPSTVPQAPDDAQLQFTTLLKQLGAGIAAAVAAGGPNAAEIKLRASEAGALGRQKEWAQGLAVLQQIEKMLPAGATATAAATAAATPAAAPKVAPGVAFTQSRLVWDQTRKKVQAELRKLEASILETSKDEPDLPEIAAGTKNLYEVLEFLDERLIDKLDEALNAADPQARQALHDEAREIVSEYVDFIESEALMQDIDENGFTSVAIKSTLVTSLGAIDQRLRA